MYMFGVFRVVIVFGEVRLTVAQKVIQFTL